MKQGPQWVRRPSAKGVDLQRFKQSIRPISGATLDAIGITIPMGRIDAQNASPAGGYDRPRTTTTAGD